MARLAPLKLDGALAGRVLRAPEAGLAMEAEALLAASRAEAERIRQAARLDADRIREEARREGLAAVEAEAQDRFFAITEASINQLARTEERIISLAIDIARRIIGDLPDHEAAERLARAALRRAAGSGMVRLRVAPAHAAMLRERVSALLTEGRSRLDIVVTDDPTINDTGCILETDAGMLDATIESQLAAIERHLRASLGEARP